MIMTTHSSHLPLRRRSARKESGSAILVALGIVAITALVLGTALIEASLRYRISNQSQHWAQAGQAAEGGAEIATWVAQNTTWTTNGFTSAPGAAGAAPVTATYTIDPVNPTTATVSVSTVTVAGNSWLQVQSIGSATVYGGRVAGIDTNDVLLRKLSFNSNRYTSAALTTPQSMRVMTVLLEPKSPFTGAMLLQHNLQMSGGSSIDSFDSGNTAYSTNGLWDITKRETNANVGINQTDGLTDLKGCYIYGSLSYTGTTPANDGNVTGGVSSPYHKNVPAVTAPTWTSYNSTPTAITGTTTLTGGTQSSPALYKVSSFNIPGGTSLTIAPYAAGQDSYAEIWITGDMVTSGSGFITQQANTHVTYYVQGNVNISGSAIANQTGIAANCVVNVINPPVGTTQTVTISGSGTLIGAVNAPGANFTISGSANLSGAFIGNTMNISGGAGVHYDQALARMSGSGPGYGYTVANLVEAVR